MMTERDPAPNLLDILGAAEWDQAIFTTFSLSLSFFEVEILDRLIRGGTSNVFVYSDLVGVRSALSEHGARRVGRSYQLEPVLVRGGVFHPKIVLLFKDGDVHALVGSGNLTFGGWGMNQETLIHLQPSFARDAFEDIADFLNTLVRDPRVRIEDTKPLRSAASRIQKLVVDYPANESIRVVHNQDSNIAQAIREHALELGGASAITVASPYFDSTGAGLKKLADLLGGVTVRVHVPDAGSVGGFTKTSWPTGAAVEPVSISFLDKDDRPLHAKLFEIACRDGSIVLSGSANATNAALFGQNVEVSVLRRFGGEGELWNVTDSEVPVLVESDHDMLEEGLEMRAVIRAVSEGDSLSGTVLDSSFRGPATLHVYAGAQELVSKEVLVDDVGNFACSIEDVAGELLKLEGRLTVTLVIGQSVAEGFVAQAEAAALARAFGNYAVKVASIASGTETPDDLADVAQLLIDNPVLQSLPRSGRATDLSAATRGGWVTAADLAPLSVRLGDRVRTVEHSAAASLLDRFLRSLSEDRGLWSDDEAADDEGVDEGGRAPTWEGGGGAHENALDSQSYEESDGAPGNDETSADSARAQLATSRLIPMLLDPRHKGRNTDFALRVANYVAGRGRPDPATAIDWLRQISNAVEEWPEQEDSAITAAAYVNALRWEGAEEGAARARSLMRRIGVDPDGFSPDETLLRGFLKTIAPTHDVSENDQLVEDFFGGVRACRSAGEQVRALRAALAKDEEPPSCDEFPTLASSPYWSELQALAADSGLGDYLEVLNSVDDPCPQCFMQLPQASVDELRAFGVTSCEGLLCWEGA